MFAQGAPDRPCRSVWPFEQDFARSRLANSGDRFQQFRLAVARDAGNADDLAGAHIEGNVVDHGDAAIVLDATDCATDSTTSPGFASPFSTRSSTRRPTISSASSSTVVSEVLRVATISPRRMTDTVSVIAMISRSLWVIRMTVLPWSRSTPRMRKRWSASAGVRHAGRLVEDQDFGAAIHGFENFDALLQADRQLLDQRIGIDLETVVRLEPLQFGARRRDALGQQARRLRRRA